jgi:hypothetical protein
MARLTCWPPYSKVSGVPQSPQNPRRTLFELWKRLGSPRVQTRASNGAPTKGQAARRLLAHAAMADGGFAEVALDAEPHGPALASAGHRHRPASIPLKPQGSLRKRA